MENVLIKKRKIVYPKIVNGLFRKFKSIILLIAYLVYYCLPWLRWERGENLPNQAILYDIVGRKYYLFDIVVYAQDIFWLAAVLIISAMFLFYITGLFGRAFCGYFCFQTLWTDAFMHVERFIQGDRNKQMRLSKAPWKLEKIVKISATHLIILFISFWTGLSFTLYWGDAPTILVEFIYGEASYSAYVTTFLLTFMTYLMGQHAREQVCLYMCPYARFQTVMIDKDTLIPAYQALRGERDKGRHKASKGNKTQTERQQNNYGDCVDCGVCLHVCPTGIDIREGHQLGCIECGLCIDACNSIMDSVKYPRGLIGYYSENQLENSPKAKNPYLKFKSFAYVTVLVVTSTLLVLSVIGRKPFEATLNQTRQPLFTVLSDATIQNRYDIKLTNKTNKMAEYIFKLEGLEGAVLDLGHFKSYTLQAEKSVRFAIKIKSNQSQVSAKKKAIKVIAINRLAEETQEVVMDTFFFSP